MNNNHNIITTTLVLYSRKLGIITLADGLSTNQLSDISNPFDRGTRLYLGLGPASTLLSLLSAFKRHLLSIHKLPSDPIFNPQSTHKPTMSQTFSPADVASHNSADKGMYIIVDTNVYDVTKFVDEHPGGAKILKRVAGKDASKQFWKVGTPQQSCYPEI